VLLVKALNEPNVVFLVRRRGPWQSGSCSWHCGISARVTTVDSFHGSGWIAFAPSAALPTKDV